MEKTKELFDEWNKQKFFIEKYKNKRKFVNIWEIWIIKIWVNIGSEISKDWFFTRPILIMSNFLWWDLVWVIPFTTQYNSNYSEYLLELENFEKYWLNKKSYLVLNQFKIVSMKRLTRLLNSTKSWKQKVSKEKISEIQEYYIKTVIKKNL